MSFINFNSYLTNEWVLLYVFILHTPYSDFICAVWSLFAYLNMFMENIFSSVSLKYQHFMGREIWGQLSEWLLMSSCEVFLSLTKLDYWLLGFINGISNTSSIKERLFLKGISLARYPNGSPVATYSAKYLFLKRRMLLLLTSSGLFRERTSLLWALVSSLVGYMSLKKFAFCSINVSPLNVLCPEEISSLYLGCHKAII